MTKLRNNDMANGNNDELTKRRNDKMAKWQHGGTAKWQVDEWQKWPRKSASHPQAGLGRLVQRPKKSSKTVSQNGAKPSPPGWVSPKNGGTKSQKIIKNGESKFWTLIKISFETWAFFSNNRSQPFRYYINLSLCARFGIRNVDLMVGAVENVSNFSRKLTFFESSRIDPESF